MKYDFDQIVIGAGIAGMTAAIYLKRAGKNVAIIEKSAPGGQINRSFKVENYPGFKAIDGPTLSMNVYDQMTSLGLELLSCEVVDIIDHESYLSVVTTLGDYTCNKVLIATGREPRSLPAKNFDSYISRGISYCALCDGNFFRQKRVIVVGGGNSAFDDALYLSGICSSVTIVVRSQIRAEQTLVQEVLAKETVSVLYGQEITEILGNEIVTGIRLENAVELPCDGIFVAIGAVPNLSFLKSISFITENGYLLVDSTMKTSHNRIYAVGDVIKKDVYQLTTAVGEASIAASFL